MSLTLSPGVATQDGVAPGEIPQTTDPRWAKPARYNVLERWFLSRMRDERDLIFVRVAGRQSAFLFTAAAVFFAFPQVVTWYVGVAYLVAVLALGMGPFILMLHATEHRALFKREHKLLNAWIPWLLAPFFGQTPKSFFAHHIGMHHVESNRGDDLSNTRPYKRDSFLNWLHYEVRFFLGGTQGLIRYFHTKGRKKYMRTFIKGELAWFVCVGLLMALNWKATLVCFVLPLLAIRVLFMTGNWAQHAFVDVNDPKNEYRNSSTIINCPYNHKCYNDGYHIVHHRKPGLHWSEMAQEFQDNWRTYRDQEAIVFDGVGNNQRVFWFLMTKNYDALERYLWRPPGDTRTKDERIALLKARAQTPGGERRGIFQVF